MILATLSFAIFPYTTLFRSVIIAGVCRMGRTVPDDLIVPVAAVAGIGAGVPLADLRRLIAVLAEHRREERSEERRVGKAYRAESSRCTYRDSTDGYGLFGCE